MFLLATGLAAASTGLAAPGAADTWEPTPPTMPFVARQPSADNAEKVINDLRSSGVKVIVDRVGTAPLDQCAVSSVTPGQPETTLVSAGGGSMTNQTTPTVFVTLDCHAPAATGVK